MKRFITLLSSIVLFTACETFQKDNILDSEETKPEKESAALVETTQNYDDNEFNKNDYNLTAPLSVTPLVIDGIADDEVWKDAKWYNLNHRWLGNSYTKEDFSGKFKLAWDAKKLYLFVSITDDLIIDKNKKWDDGWWNDDCVEIFIDEDNGDDLHQFNHKAFAYHVALNAKDVVDLGTDSLPHLYNNHITAAKNMANDKSINWEFAIDIYSDSFKDNSKNKPVVLSSGKEMGFALAYCDSDTSKTRENFIGSIPMKGKTDQERDQGWKDAGVFNTLILK